MNNSHLLSSLSQITIPYFFVAICTFSQKIPGHLVRSSVSTTKTKQYAFSKTHLGHCLTWPFHSIWCLVPSSVWGGKLKVDFLTNNKIHQELTFNPVSPDDPITSGSAILPWQESKHRSDQYQSILSGVWLFTFNNMTLQYFDHLDLIRSASRVFWSES